jgi:hypothetical protein
VDTVENLVVKKCGCHWNWNSWTPVAI